MKDDEEYDIEYNGCCMQGIKNAQEVMRKVKNQEYRNSDLPYSEWLESIIEWEDGYKREKEERNDKFVWKWSDLTPIPSDEEEGEELDFDSDEEQM